MPQRRRLARSLLGALLLLVARESAAQAIVVRVYPLSEASGGGAGTGTDTGTDASVAADAQSLLAAAVPIAERRSAHLAAATPIVLRPTCGRLPGAACLAPLAEQGVVVWGTARSAGNQLVVTLQAVDERAGVHGPVQARVDSFAQSSEPLVTALLELEAIYVSATTTPATARPASRPPQVAAGPAAPASGDGLRYRETRRGPSRLQGTLGKWTTGGGLLLLAGGATVAALNFRLAQDLEDRFDRNALTPSDASSYRQIDQYNKLQTALFVAGGALTLTGVVLWGLAPDVRPTDRGAIFGVQGRF